MSYVDRVVKAFGGVRPMAKAMGLSPSTVQGWKLRGSIPDEHKVAAWHAARSRSVALDRSDLSPLPSDAGDDAA